MHVGIISLFIINLVIAIHLNVSCVSCFNLKGVVKQLIRFPIRIGQFLGIKESCSSNWIRTNPQGLKEKLKEELFGQQLAHELIPLIFENYWKNSWSSKYLLLCLYGGPGTGKTFSTKVLNKYIFTAGDRSYYYHFYSGAESHLPLEALQRLKEEMLESIVEAIEECPYSIIVFDEADKYPKGFLDSVIMPLIINNPTKQGPHRRATFIFLTNIGSKEVMEQALRIDSSYFKSHHVDHYNPIVTQLKTISQDGLFSSELVQKGLIENFVPFLPLKEESVVRCIERSLSHYGFAGFSSQNTAQLISIILEQVDFVDLYASSGCKRLDSLVSSAITKQFRLSYSKQSEL